MQQKTRTALRLGLWLASIAVVLALGLYYFPREYPGVTFWESLYYTLRLFVFEHDLPSFPRSLPLIFIHFAAPLISVSAAGTAISHLFRLTPAVRTRLMSDHVLLCGVGSVGKLVATTLKKRGVAVAGVDHGPVEEFSEFSLSSGVPVLQGDFRAPSLLLRAGARRARAIIFASGDDLSNLEGALGAYDLLRDTEGPVKLIWAHIANERLAETARRAVRTRGRVGIRFFDTYRLAASRVITRHFHRDIRKAVNEVSILGFGKFGRDLLEILVKESGPDEHFVIRVVDIEDRSLQVTALAEELEVKDRVHFVRSAIQELGLANQADKAYFLCTDDDLGNLTAAMTLASKMGAATVYVRMAAWPLSAVAEHVEKKRGLTFININDLMCQGIEQLAGLFTPASEEDLKRVEGDAVC